MAYLAYHVSDYNEGKDLPIAAGLSRDDALSLGARNVLQLGWTDGGLSIVENDNLSQGEVAAINSAVDEYLSGERATQ